MTTERECAYVLCRRTFDAADRGRPRLTCSPACRKARHRHRHTGRLTLTGPLRHDALSMLT